MSLSLTPQAFSSVAGGLVLVALGLAIIGAVRPRRRETTALGVFAIGFGLGFVLNNLFTVEDPVRHVVVPLAAVVWLATIGALAVVLRALPAPLERSERGAVVGGILAGGTMALALASQIVTNPTMALRGGPTEFLVVSYVTGIVLALLIGALLAAVFVLTLRYPKHAADASVRRQLVLMSAALLVYPAFAAAAGPYASRSLSLAVVPTTAAILVLTALAVLWLRNAAHSPEPRPARTMALLALAAGLAGLLHVVFGLELGHGITRVASVAVLAYAILRHQLLGLDVTVRWTIKRGTVAGVFLAVFFVVSQIAQNTLSDYGTLLGGAAAGLLLFAIAPLQRAAERVADAAVPLAGEAPVARGKEDSFRAALRLAMKDGRLAATEQREMAVLAEDLRIPARRAFELVDEVAAERGRATGRRVEVER